MIHGSFYFEQSGGGSKCLRNVYGAVNFGIQLSKRDAATLGCCWRVFYDSLPFLCSIHSWWLSLFNEPENVAFFNKLSALYNIYCIFLTRRSTTLCFCRHMCNLNWMYVCAWAFMLLFLHLSRGIPFSNTSVIASYNTYSQMRLLESSLIVYIIFLTLFFLKYVPENKVLFKIIRLDQTRPWKIKMCSYYRGNSLRFKIFFHLRWLVSFRMVAPGKYNTIMCTLVACDALCGAHMFN